MNRLMHNLDLIGLLTHGTNETNETNKSNRTIKPTKLMKPVKPIKPLLTILITLGMAAIIAAGSSFSIESIPKEWLESGFKQHDFSLYFQAEDVMQLASQEDSILLIDVRSKEDYERIRIPHSINIALFAVKTKTYLKAKRIILFNEGYACERLETECRKLKELGFNVRILNGGLLGWKARGGQLEGSALALEEINQIPAKAFFVEKNYQNWKIINTSLAISSDARRLVSYAWHIPFVNEKQFLSDIEKRLHREQPSPYRGLLLFNEDGNAYNAIEQAIRKIRVDNCFFLKNGLAGYKEFLKQQDLSKTSQERIKTSGAKCPACAD